MVTQERKLVTIKEAERIFKESNGNAELASQKLRHLPKRQPQPPAPEGGISLLGAEHKYGIPNGTLSRWVRKGWLRVIERTKFKVYVDEAELTKMVDVYRKDAGRGSWVMKKLFEGAAAT